MVRSLIPTFFLPMYVLAFTHTHILARVTQILYAFLNVLRGGMVVRSPHLPNA